MLLYVKRKCILAFHSIFRSPFIFYFMITNFYSFLYKKKNNCGCSPEPEFIEEIVEIIRKILYEESPTSTIPPCRQNDVPGQYSVLCRLKMLLSGPTLFFFFPKFENDWKWLINITTDDLNSSWLSHFSLASPFNFQLKIIK